MSTSYYFYVEAKNNGKWVCINPIVKAPNGEYQMEPLLWGQSYLRETYEDMIETSGCHCGVPEDASQEIIGRFRPLDETTKDFIGKEMTWREYYKHFVHVVNYDEAVRSRIKKDRPFKYQGYVYKHLIAAFEVGEEDIRYWLSRDEYEAMSEQEQKEYAWYEWNDYDGEYGILYDIYTMVENLLGWYRQNALFKSKQYNYEDFIASNVRLIIYMS